MTTTTSERDLVIARALGRLIAHSMWDKKVTQTSLADAIGLTQSTLGKKLRGLVPITVDELAEIAELLSEEPGDLMLRACRDSNPKPSDP